VHVGNQRDEVSGHERARWGKPRRDGARGEHSALIRDPGEPESEAGARTSRDEVSGHARPVRGPNVHVGNQLGVDGNPFGDEALDRPVPPAVPIDVDEARGGRRASGERFLCEHTGRERQEQDDGTEWDGFDVNWNGWVCMKTLPHMPGIPAYVFQPVDDVSSASR
jgi:hypothetical protein